MSRLLLKQSAQTMEISHIYYLVSAYVATENGDMGYEELRRAVVEAVKIAKRKTETQIVDFDRSDFCLHVHPSGAVSLMAAINRWDKFEFSE